MNPSKRPHATARSQYRRIPRYLWNDLAFRRVGPDAQFIFLFLWTHPGSNATGVTATTPPAIALTHGWPAERAEVALAALEAAGLAEVDSEAGLIGLNTLQFDPPDNGKMVRHWAKCLVDLPPSGIVTRALDRLGAHCEMRTPGFREAFADLMAELPPQLRQDHTVCRTVSGGYGIQGRRKKEELEIPPPPPDPDPERKPSRARVDGPESVGSIIARMRGGMAS